MGTFDEAHMARIRAANTERPWPVGDGRTWDSAYGDGRSPEWGRDDEIDPWEGVPMNADLSSEGGRVMGTFDEALDALARIEAAARRRDGETVRGSADWDESWERRNEGLEMVPEPESFDRGVERH